jgi:dephospho-CoA kinase
MLVIGLTGGIGSGKSTVAKILADADVVVIDADAISRASTQPGGLAMPGIQATWGPSFITADGALNRDAMRELILREPTAKARLEAIIHPLVSQEIDRKLTLARHASASLAVLDIPLLVEAGARWRQRLNAVWVVDCLPQTQIARVQARSGWPLTQIEAVMAAQASRAQRLACADAVICNEGVSLQELQTQVLSALRVQNWGKF